MTYNTEGVILRIRDYREHCRLFTIYSPDLGKIKITARSARKAKSKLRATLQYFSVLKLYLAKGRLHDIVAGVSSEKNYRLIKKDLFKVALGKYCIEMVDKLIGEGVRDDVVYTLITEFFNTLESLDSNTQKREMVYAVHCFSVALLGHLGYAPSLNECVFCHDEILERSNEKLFFSYEDGGVVCRNCSHKGKEFDSLEFDNLKVLEKMLMQEPLRAEELGPESFSKLNRIVPVFLKYRMGRGLFTEEFLRIFKN